MSEGWGFGGLRGLPDTKMQGVGWGGGQLKNRKTKLSLTKMSNYKNPFRFKNNVYPKK